MTLSAQLENQGQRKQARPLSVLTMDTLEIQRIAPNSTGDFFFTIDFIKAGRTAREEFWGAKVGHRHLA